MNTNKLIVGGLAGGVAAFLFGFLIWGLALSSFMEAHSTAVPGSEKEPMVMWSLIIGSLAYGFLYAFIYERWAGISTLKTGAIAGSILGLLIGINFDFMTYSMIEIVDFTGVIVDIIAYVIYGALVGGVVGWVLGMGRKVAEA